MKTNEAPLNAKQRKALPASAFCAPNRGFPANDCNHVKAGLSLLGKYKGPGDKNKIRQCLFKKAGKLGCFKKKGESEADFMPALAELELTFRDGMLSQDDLLAELVRFGQMGSVSDADMAKIVALCHSAKPFLAVTALMAALS